MEVKVNRWNGEAWENCCECDICGRLATVINFWKDYWFCANCLNAALKQIEQALLARSAAVTIHKHTSDLSGGPEPA